MTGKIFRGTLPSFPHLFSIKPIDKYTDSHWHLFCINYLPVQAFSGDIWEAKSIKRVLLLYTLCLKFPQKVFFYNNDNFLLNHHQYYKCQCAPMQIALRNGDKDSYCFVVVILSVFHDVFFFTLELIVMIWKTSQHFWSLPYSSCWLACVQPGASGVCESLQQRGSFTLCHTSVHSPSQELWAFLLV